MTRQTVAWARLPIQDELTLALAGRVSRSLTLVKGGTSEETKEEKYTENQVSHGDDFISFLSRRSRDQICLWD
jgi:hypothetical protein